MTIQIPLLEILAFKMNCQYLSDLHFLDAWECDHLAWEVENLPCQMATLEEWNDALCYLTSEVPEKTSEAAQKSLVMFLRRISKGE